MKKLLSTLTFILAVFASFGQTGSVSGSVLEEGSKLEIIGATVIVKGTGIGSVTDLYGNYTISNAPEGEITLVFSYIGYESVERKVTVKPRENVTLNVSLKESTQTLEGVTVVADRKTNTEAAVLVDVKEAKQIVSGVSKQQMERSQDKTAADAMQRIPGITIIENRFVLIRGISSRYNSVMINNVVAPSTEVDRRTFSFDMIGSGSLDRMMIYKSGSAELPGDFAGGVIKLYTVNTVEKNFTKVTIGTGYRMNTTLKPYFQSKGSSTDFLSFDNGFRKLPNDFASTDELSDEPSNSEFRREQALKLENNFNPTERTALPDMGMGLSIGRVFTIGKKRVSNITNITYSNSYQYMSRDFFRYLDSDTYDGSSPLSPRFDYIDDIYQNDVKVNVMSNFSVILSNKSKIVFSNLLNNIGENETILRNGRDYIQNNQRRNYLLGYKNRTLYTSQLEGMHTLDDKERQNLNWVVGFSYLGEIEPDLRRFRTYKNQNQASDETGLIMQLPPSSNLFDTGRYFGELDETTSNVGLNFTYDLNESRTFKRQLKMGFYSDYRSRNFSSRYFSYLYPGYNESEIGEEISRLPLDEIFAAENIATRNGLVLEEGTRKVDSYQATNLLNAAYVGVVYPVANFVLNGGVRAEYNIQTLSSANGLNDVEVNNPIFSFLPFANASYNLSEKSLVRLGYGRTVNRPEFRELAPFLFYDYKMDAARVGNENLKSATINNLDLRYEFYPRMGETFSLGAFYKHFTNPIEDRTIITTEQPTFTYINADVATNYGLELEFRKSFRGLTKLAFLDKISINMNAAYIQSLVDLGETAVAQDRTRPLQGQSPYIVNTALAYNDNKSGLSATLVYNIFGRRIYSVGDDIFPTLYELERHSVDLTVGKDFGKKTHVKFGIQDLLNAPYRFWQDSDRSTKIDQTIDHKIISFRRGTLFSLSATFNLQSGNKN